jgi:transposase
VIGRTKDGMITKLHAVADAEGRPIRSFTTTGEVSDCTAGRRSPRQLADGAGVAG